MYVEQEQGLGCISAKIVADSVSSRGLNVRITTFELEYPRFIHAELMTHRMFSRNAMSSRAVPIAKMIEQVRENPAMPIHWGKNQSGMQAKEVLSGVDLAEVVGEWNWAANNASDSAEFMDQNKAHKQIANRILEPFQVMKTIVTATEFNNWWHLRDHEDAQPEIAELARVMRNCYTRSEPEMLFDGEWHTPYVNHRDVGDMLSYYVVDDNGVETLLDVEAAQKVSASCCAQVSFRLNDNSVEKAIKIYDRLVESKPVHSSPFEHQATPMKNPSCFPSDPTFCGSDGGTTHLDVDGRYWSGNFKQWVQYRQLIPNNTMHG